MRSRRKAGYAVVVLCCVPASLFAGELPKTFTLGRYVPGDCWLYVHGVHNPEADFVNEHWSRVCSSLQQSGVGGELLSIFTQNLPAEERARWDSFWGTATQLAKGVRWWDLVSKEFVFAERFGGPMPVPDLIFLGRNDAATLEANVTGLRAILDACTSFGEGVSVAEESLQGARVWSLTIVNVPFTVHLLNKDNIIGLFMGRRGLEDTVRLLAGEKSETAIVRAPRFLEALAQVPSPEGEVAFFDVQSIFAYLKTLPEMIASAKACHAPGAAPDPAVQSEANQIKCFIFNILDQCNIFDYAITTQETNGRQQFVHEFSRLLPDYKSKALGRMLTNTRPIERFDTFIPMDAVGFSVWSGIDWLEAYRIVLGVIKDLGPKGEAALAKWKEFQASKGFNIEEDVLGWISGEMVSVSLKPAVANPFGGMDSVTLLRVRDPKRAAQKIDAGLNRLNAFLQEHQQPPFLVPLTITPASGIQAEGFKSVTHPMFMMMLRPVVGVSGDWLVIGSSESAVNRCLETAAGKVQTIAENPRFRKEGITPKGPVCSASFQDLSNWGQEVGGALSMMGFVGGFIPDEPDTRQVKAIFSAMAKLGPVFFEIDFYSSMSSVCTSDELRMTTETVVTYKPAKPAEPAAAAAATAR